jgi:hypothetical protein
MRVKCPAMTERPRRLTDTPRFSVSIRRACKNISRSRLRRSPLHDKKAVARVRRAVEDLCPRVVAMK